MAGFLKNVLSKKENVGDLASNLKSLEQKIDGFQTTNASERGSIKTILQDIKTGEADVVKAAEDIKKLLYQEDLRTKVLGEN